MPRKLREGVDWLIEEEALSHLPMSLESYITVLTHLENAWNFMLDLEFLVDLCWF